ncbi:hypothetical protein FACS1894124_3440 [Spirochaetia bacterium]|nr:hypothetical protein FACS1894124_3440 [Spirochaetia bacterium]
MGEFKRYFKLPPNDRLGTPYPQYYAPEGRGIKPPRDLKDLNLKDLFKTNNANNGNTT